MTSNIGTAEIGKAIGYRTDTSFRAPNYQTVLKRFFRPEFLNRLDEVIVFNPLTPQVLENILELNLRDIRARLAKQQLTLQIEPGARDLILSHGYDQANGARPLRRAIERLLTRPLSQSILDRSYMPRTRIVVSAENERLTFTTQHSEQSEDREQHATAGS